jgi:hypothetical protein
MNGRKLNNPGLWDRYLGVAAGLLVTGFALHDSIVAYLAAPDWVDAVFGVGLGMLAAVLVVAVFKPRRLSLETLRFLVSVPALCGVRWVALEDGLLAWRLVAYLVVIAIVVRLFRRSVREKADALAASGHS